MKRFVGLLVITLILAACSALPESSDPVAFSIDLSAYDAYDSALVVLYCNDEDLDEEDKYEEISIDLTKTDWKVDLAEINPSCGAPVFSGFEELAATGANTNLHIVTGVDLSYIALFSNDGTAALHPFSDFDQDAGSSKGTQIMYANEPGHAQFVDPAYSDPRLTGGEVYNMNINVSFSAGWAVLFQEFTSPADGKPGASSLRTISPADLRWDLITY